MNSTTKQMTFAIMLALVLWGVYLAIGATGFFVQSTMTDGRKSLIVIVCMALFLGLWAIVIRTQQPQAKSDSHQSDSQAAQEGPTAPQIGWSKSGIATVVWAVAGTTLWWFAISTWKSVALTTTTMFGWLAAFCVVASATSGMMSLSDPQPRRGKWLGLLGLLGLAGSLIGFVARMTP